MAEKSCLAHLVPVRCNTQTLSTGVHRRTSRGDEGGCSPPQLERFLKFFGQNADDSGKSTREKTL